MILEPCVASSPPFCSSGRANSLLSYPPERTSIALHWLITSAGFEKNIYRKGLQKCEYLVFIKYSDETHRRSESKGYFGHKCVSG